MLSSFASPDTLPPQFLLAGRYSILLCTDHVLFQHLVGLSHWAASYQLFPVI